MTIFPDAGSASLPPWSRLIALPVAFLFTLPFALALGWIVGLVPGFLGTTVLALIGDRSRALRHPLIWAATGAIMGAITARVIGIDATYPKYGYAWAGATGTICMLLSRRHMRWR